MKMKSAQTCLYMLRPSASAAEKNERKLGWVKREKNCSPFQTLLPLLLSFSPDCGGHMETLAPFNSPPRFSIFKRGIVFSSFSSPNPLSSPTPAPRSPSPARVPQVTSHKLASWRGGNCALESPFPFVRIFIASFDIYRVVGIFANTYTNERANKLVPWAAPPACLRPPLLLPPLLSPPRRPFATTPCDGGRSGGAGTREAPRRTASPATEADAAAKRNSGASTSASWTLQVRLPSAFTQAHTHTHFCLLCLMAFFFVVLGSSHLPLPLLCHAPVH